MDAGRLAAERVAAPQPGGDRRGQLLLADAGVDADRQVSGIGQAAVRLERRPQPRLDGERARVVDGDDAQRHEGRAQGRDRALEVVGGDCRDVPSHEPGCRLVEHAGCPPVVAPDQPAVRVGGGFVDTRRFKGGVTHPQRVVVGCPE